MGSSIGKFGNRKPGVPFYYDTLKLVYKTALELETYVPLNRHEIVIVDLNAGDIYFVVKNSEVADFNNSLLAFTHNVRRYELTQPDIKNGIIRAYNLNDLDFVNEPSLTSGTEIKFNYWHRGVMPGIFTEEFGPEFA